MRQLQHPVFLLVGGVGLTLALAGCGGIGKAAKGGGESPTKTAAAAQPLTPVEQIDTWLNAFHVNKDDPSHTMEVQHYCDVMNKDLIQCALYDGSTGRSRLVGVEYIVSEVAFNGFGEDEQAYWHPHNYEVLSGTLVAPAMPAGQEKSLMSDLLNTYGKTWHTWPMGEPGEWTTPIPTGDAKLGWSFNAPGEAPEALIDARNKRLGIDMEEVQERRRELIRDAHPQKGVDALKDAFPNRRPFRGVQEATPERTRGTD